MVTGIYEQADVSAREEYTRGISDRRAWTAVLLLVVSLIALLGASGCASTQHSAMSPSTSASSGDTTPQTTEAELSTSNPSVDFGNVQVGTPTSQLITLTNTGNASLNIVAISASGSGFTTSGSSNITLAPNQSENVYVNFTPTAAGAAVGTVGVASNAVNSMVSINVSGTGVTSQQAHTVELSWTPSPSNVVGYFIDRSNTTGGPYTRLSITADTNSSYTDTNVTSGTYFYVVTAVDSNNVQSQYSNEVQAIVP